MTEDLIKYYSIDKITIPLSKLRLQKKNGNFYVWDEIRKKYVVLTPEEFVRQNFVAWLTTSFGYPKTHIANEIEINLNGTKKRCDSIIYSSDFKPQVIIEYKAPGIPLNAEIFNQILRYNFALKAKFLIISNGVSHYCIKVDYQNQNYDFLDFIPDYNYILNN